MLENSINNYFVQSIPFGFGLITFILIYFKTVLKIETHKLIENSIILIRYFGIFFLLLWIINLLNDDSLFERRFTGKYWFSGWFLMFTYPVLSQLLWIDKLKRSTFFVYLISLLFLISNLIYSGKIVCFDGDCDINSFFVGIFKEIGIYILVLLSVTYLVKNEK